MQEFILRIAKFVFFLFSIVYSLKATFLYQYKSQVNKFHLFLRFGYQFFCSWLFCSLLLDMSYVLISYENQIIPLNLDKLSFQYMNLDILIELIIILILPFFAYIYYKNLATFNVYNITENLSLTFWNKYFSSTLFMYYYLFLIIFFLLFAFGKQLMVFFGAIEINQSNINDIFSQTVSTAFNNFTIVCVLFLSQVIGFLCLFKNILINVQKMKSKLKNILFGQQQNYFEESLTESKEENKEENREELQQLLEKYVLTGNPIPQSEKEKLDDLIQQEAILQQQKVKVSKNEALASKLPFFIKNCFKLLANGLVFGCYCLLIICAIQLTLADFLFDYFKISFRIQNDSLKVIFNPILSFFIKYLSLAFPLISLTAIQQFIVYLIGNFLIVLIFWKILKILITVKTKSTEIIYPEVAIHQEIIKSFLSLFQGIFCFLLIALIFPEFIFFNQNLSKCNLQNLDLRTLLNLCEVSRNGLMIIKIYSSLNIKLAFAILNAIFIFLSLGAVMIGIIKSKDKQLKNLKFAKYL